MKIHRNTLDFLSTWEVLYNKDFKVFESEHFRKQVGLLTFTPSVSEWVDKTNAKGLYAKKGKYGGTYAHKDIAFEFASGFHNYFVGVTISRPCYREISIKNKVISEFFAERTTDSRPYIFEKMQEV